MEDKTIKDKLEEAKKIYFMDEFRAFMRRKDYPHHSVGS